MGAPRLGSLGAQLCRQLQNQRQDADAALPRATCNVQPVQALHGAVVAAVDDHLQGGWRVASRVANEAAG